jgi:5-amino-6-(5-phospho-D-ribitylamino)uracil phosphatase
LKKPVIRLLVFDMGHVFIRFSWDAVCQAFCQHAQITADEFRLVLNDVKRLGYEQGKISTENFVAEMGSYFKTGLTQEQFARLWNTSLEEDPEMADLLTKLSRTYPLYLLSNTNECHYTHIQTTFNVARHFQEHILSYKVGHTKPEPEIYHEIFKRGNVKPSECIFVDDLAINIEAGQELGMHTILFQGVDDLKSRLAIFGIVV